MRPALSNKGAINYPLHGYNPFLSEVAWVDTVTKVSTILLMIKLF